MLCAPLKLGVLNPAGASVADFAATLAGPVPSAVNAAKRQEERRTFLQWGMSMSVPPKDTSSLRVRGRKLADRLTPESSEPRRMIENHGLKSEVLCVSKLDCVKIIPTAKKILKRMKRLDP
jgi:hypothetical protein